MNRQTDGLILLDLVGHGKKNDNKMLEKQSAKTIEHESHIQADSTLNGEPRIKINEIDRSILFIRYEIGRVVPTLK